MDTILEQFVNYLIGEKKYKEGDKEIPIYYLNVDGNLVLLVILDDTSALYIPELDLFIPADLALLQKVLSAESNSAHEVGDVVNARNDENINYDENVYNILRPPLSARVIYASEIPEDLIKEAKELAVKALSELDSFEGKVTLYKKPVTSEFYKKGYEIEDTRDKKFLSEIDEFDRDAIIRYLESAIEEGTTYLLFDNTFKSVVAKVLRDLSTSDKSYTPIYFYMNNKGNAEIYSHPKIDNLYPLGSRTDKDIGVELNNLEDLPLKLTPSKNSRSEIILISGTDALPLYNSKILIDSDGAYKVTGTDLKLGEDVTVIFRDRNKAVKVNDNYYVFPNETKFSIVKEFSGHKKFVDNISDILEYLESNAIEIRKDDIGKIIYKSKQFELPDAIKAIAEDLLAPVHVLENILTRIPRGSFKKIIIIKQGYMPELSKEAQELNNVRDHLMAALQNDSNEALSLLFSSIAKLSTIIPEEVDKIRETLLGLINHITKIRLSLELSEDPNKDNIKDLMKDVSIFIVNGYKELVL